jgi:hypothetical protein
MSRRPRPGQEKGFTSGKWLASRKGFGGNSFTRAFAFPFVVFAKQGFVFFHLRFDFVEGFFAAGAEVFAGCGRVQCSGGESEIQGKCVPFFAWQFGKYGVQLHKIRLVGFQKYV